MLKKIFEILNLFLLTQRWFVEVKSRNLKFLILSFFTEAELKKLLRKLRDENPVSRDQVHLKELCRCDKNLPLLRTATSPFDKSESFVLH